MEITAAINACRFLVLYQKTKRIILVGRLLHVMTLLGMTLFFYCGQLALKTAAQNQSSLFLLYSLIACYGLILVFFAQMDALSRYQNYKKAKDLFFENGFKIRIVNLYIISRCQRDAIRIAARDLNYEAYLNRYYKACGYQWFHLLPDFMFSKPWIIFSNKYWQKTLFEKKYESKHFLW